MGTCHGVQGVSNIGGKLLGKGLMVKPNKGECPKLRLLLLVYCISPHMGHWLSKGRVHIKPQTPRSTSAHAEIKSKPQISKMLLLS